MKLDRVTFFNRKWSNGTSEKRSQPMLTIDVYRTQFGLNEYHRRSVFFFRLYSKRYFCHRFVMQPQSFRLNFICQFDWSAWSNHSKVKLFGQWKQWKESLKMPSEMNWDALVSSSTCFILKDFSIQTRYFLFVIF